MCITNQFTNETLKAIRTVEVDATSMSERELCEALVRIKKIREDMEWAEEKIKKHLKEREFNGIEMFPELEAKVYLAEGRSSSTINAADFMLAMKNEGLSGMIPDCVSVVKTKCDILSDPTVTKILETFTIKEEGKPSIAVRSMSKKELMEHKA
jgi:hypothetical protein